MLAAWLGAFALTQLVETPIHGRALAHRGGWPTRLALGFGASLFTHPIVFFGFPRFFPYDHGFGVAAAELFAVAAEALYLRRLGVEQAVAWSLLANGASLLVGYASRALFGWP